MKTAASFQYHNFEETNKWKKSVYLLFSKIFVLWQHFETKNFQIEMYLTLKNEYKDFLSFGYCWLSVIFIIEFRQLWMATDKYSNQLDVYFIANQTGETFEQRDLKSSMEFFFIRDKLR